MASRRRVTWEGGAASWEQPPVNPMGPIAFDTAPAQWPRARLSDQALAQLAKLNKPAQKGKSVDKEPKFPQAWKPRAYFFQVGIVESLMCLLAFNVLGDGNCLFRAIALACEGSQAGHSALRSKCAKHLVENKAEFLSFFVTVGGPSAEAQFQALALNLATDGAHAGDYELKVLCAVCKRDISVFRLYNGEYVTRLATYTYTGGGELAAGPIRLLYDEAGTHYLALLTPSEVDRLLRVPGAAQASSSSTFAAPRATSSPQPAPVTSFPPPPSEANDTFFIGTTRVPFGHTGGADARPAPRWPVALAQSYAAYIGWFRLTRDMQVVGAFVAFREQPGVCLGRVTSFRLRVCEVRPEDGTGNSLVAVSDLVALPSPVQGWSAAPSAAPSPVAVAAPPLASDVAAARTLAAMSAAVSAAPPSVQPAPSVPESAAADGVRRSRRVAARRVAVESAAAQAAAGPPPVFVPPALHMRDPDARLPFWARQRRSMPAAKEHLLAAVLRAEACARIQRHAASFNGLQTFVGQAQNMYELVGFEVPRGGTAPQLVVLLLLGLDGAVPVGPFAALNLADLAIGVMEYKTRVERLLAQRAAKNDGPAPAPGPPKGLLRRPFEYVSSFKASGPLHNIMAVVSSAAELEAAANAVGAELAAILGDEGAGACALVVLVDGAAPLANDVTEQGLQANLGALYAALQHPRVSFSLWTLRAATSNVVREAFELASFETTQVVHPEGFAAKGAGVDASSSEESAEEEAAEVKDVDSSSSSPLPKRARRGPPSSPSSSSSCASSSPQSPPPPPPPVAPAARRCSNAEKALRRQFSVVLEGLRVFEHQVVHELGGQEAQHAGSLRTRTCLALIHALRGEKVVLRGEAMYCVAAACSPVVAETSFGRSLLGLGLEPLHAIIDVYDAVPDPAGLLAKIKSKCASLAGVATTEVEALSGPASEVQNFPTSYVTAKFDVCVQGNKLTVVAHFRCLGVPGVIYTGVEHSHMCVGVCGGRLVHDLVRPQGEAILRALTEVFIGGHTIILEARRLSAGQLEEHVAASSSLDSDASSAGSEDTLSPGLLGGEGLLTPAVLARDAKRLGLSVRSNANSPFARLGEHLLLNGALGEDAVFVHVDADGAWVRMDKDAELPRQASAVYFTSSTTLGVWQEALAAIKPAGVGHVHVGLGQITLKPTEMYNALVRAPHCHFAFVTQEGGTSPLPCGGDLDDAAAAKTRIGKVLASVAFLQGCAGHAPIDGCGTVPPGVAYAKLAVFHLEHFTQRKTLKKNLHVSAADDPDASDEVKAQAKKDLADYIADVHSAVNRARAVVLRVAFQAMSRLRCFDVSKTFLGQLLRLSLDWDTLAAKDARKAKSRARSQKSKRRKKAKTKSSSSSSSSSGKAASTLTSAERALERNRAEVVEVIRGALEQNHSACALMCRTLGVRAEDYSSEELRSVGLVNVPQSFLVGKDIKPAARCSLSSYVVGQLGQSMDQFFDVGRVAKELLATAKRLAKDAEVDGRQVCWRLAEQLEEVLGAVVMSVGQPGKEEGEEDDVSVEEEESGVELSDDESSSSSEEEEDAEAEDAEDDDAHEFDAADDDDEAGALEGKKTSLEVLVRVIESKAGRSARPDDEACIAIDEVLAQVLTDDVLESLRLFLAAADGQVHYSLGAAHPSRAIKGQRALTTYFAHNALVALGRHRIGLGLAAPGATVDEQAAATTRALYAHLYGVGADEAQRADVPGDNASSLRQDEPPEGMLPRVALFPTGRLSVLTRFCKTVLSKAPPHIKSLFPSKEPNEYILKLFGDFDKTNAEPARARTGAGTFMSDGVSVYLLYSRAGCTTRFTCDSFQEVAALFNGAPEQGEDDTPQLGRTATLGKHVHGDFSRAKRSVLHLPERFLAASRRTDLPFHLGAAGVAHIQRNMQDPSLHTTARFGPVRTARLHATGSLERTARFNKQPGVGPCQCANCVHDEDGGGVGVALSPLEEDVRLGRVVVVGVDPGKVNCVVVVKLVGVLRWRDDYEAFESIATVRATQLREASTASLAHRNRAMLKEKKLFEALDAARMCAFVPNDDDGPSDRAVVCAEALRNLQLTGALLTGFDSKKHRQARFAAMRRAQAAVDTQASEICAAARGGDTSVNIVFFWGSAQFGGSYADVLMRAVMRQPNVTLVKTNEANSSARCASCYSYLCKNVYTSKALAIKSKWTGQLVRPKERNRSWCSTCQRAHGRDASAAVSIARRGMLGVVGEEDMLANPGWVSEAHEIGVLKRFLLRLDATARGALPFELPDAVDDFGPVWTVGALRDAVRLHHVLKARQHRAARQQRQQAEREEKRRRRQQQHLPPLQGAARDDASESVRASERHVVLRRVRERGSI